MCSGGSGDQDVSLLFYHMDQRNRFDAFVVFRRDLEMMDIQPIDTPFTNPTLQDFFNAMRPVFKEQGRVFSETGERSIAEFKHVRMSVVDGRMDVGSEWGDSWSPYLMAIPGGISCVKLNGRVSCVSVVFQDDDFFFNGLSEGDARDGVLRLLKGSGLRMALRDVRRMRKCRAERKRIHVRD